jgi:hypothetical protein
MAKQADLTGDQREAFQKNEADFAELDKQLQKVRDGARSRLREVGYEPDESQWCLRCACPNFERDHYHPRKCARKSCQHLDTVHF